MGDTETDDVFGRLAVNPPAGEPDLSGNADHHVADGTKRRRFTGTVGAQHRRDAAFLHSQVDSLQNLRRPIGSIDVAQFENGPHSSPPR
jgi:hypothetical protein